MNLVQIKSTIVQLANRANTIRKKADFSKCEKENEVSSIIEDLEEDLTVSSYSIKETKQVVQFFVGIIAQATYY